MFRSLWIHKLLGLRSRSVRRREASQKRRPIRPFLEGLEDRIAPAGTINVTNGGTGANSLYNAITTVDASPAQTFTINVQNNIDLQQANLAITNTAGVTIKGNGHTVDAAAGVNIRLFAVGAGASVSFSNITLSGGKVSGTNGAFTNTPGIIGGAAIADIGGTVKLTDVTISGNTAFTAAGQAAIEGGGIFVNGAGKLLTSGNTQITGNSATFKTVSGTAVHGSEARGGGVFVSGTMSTTSGTLTLKGNTVTSGNTAGTASGGGLATGAGARVTLTNATVTGNTATFEVATIAGGDSLGGGIALLGGTLNLNNVTVTLNTAKGDNDTAAGGGNGLGGGLLVSGGTTANVVNASFINNTAAGGDTTAAAPGGNGNGGGIESFGTLNLINSTLGQNTAQGGLGTGPGAGVGGGLNIAAGATTLVNDTIALNTAKNGAGTGGTGGGVSGAAPVSALNNIIQDNSAATAPDTAAAIPGLPANFVGTGPGSPLVIAPSLAQQLVAGVTQQYFPLLAAVSGGGANPAIGTGNISANSTIASFEGVAASATTDQIGKPRTTQNGTAIDFGAVEFSSTANTVTVTASPSSLSVPQGTTSVPSVSVSIVNSNGSPVTAGTLTETISGVTGSITSPVTSSPVSIPNVITGPLALPSNLAPGTYTITLSYSNPSTGVTGSTTVALTITSTVPTTPTTPTTPTPPPPPTPSVQQAALTIAVDFAAVLLQLNTGVGNAAQGLLQLNLISQVFLHVTLPTSIPTLVSAIQYNVGFADDLVNAALSAGSSYANSFIHPSS
jgi:fibronectin-binding autotransporter adhesin